MRDIQQTLFEIKDDKYRDLTKKLIPTVEEDRIIGVRTPELKKLAAELIRDGRADQFTKETKHSYFEEDQLHAFIISKQRDYDRAVQMCDEFLPAINNWATCDQLRPAVFKKHKDQLLERIDVWIKSRHTYTVRFAMQQLMLHYLKEDFDKSYCEMVCSSIKEEYYVKKMAAWYFAEALAWQYDTAVDYLQKERLGIWVHNKTIQKACESRKISDKDKEYLKKLRKKPKK